MEKHEKQTDKDLLRRIEALHRRIDELEAADKARMHPDFSLSSGKDYFQALIEYSTDMISILNQDGTVRYVNPATEQISGYKLEELIGRNAFEFIHPDELSNVADIFDRGVQTPGYTVSIENRLQRKDGTWIDVEISGTNLLNNPLVEGMVLNCRYISERKLAQEAIRKREAEYSSLVELSPDGIIVIRGRELIFMNEKASEIFSYPISECLGQDVFELLAPNLPDVLKEIEKQGLIADMANSLETNTESQTYSLPILNGVGETLWIEISASPAQFRGENVRLAFLRDITERKQWEAVLQESESKFRAIFENANDEIIYLDKNGIIVDRNIKGEDITGYTFDEVIGKNIDQLAHVMPEAQLTKMTEVFTSAMEGTGGQGLVEVELTHKNGAPVLVEASISLLKKASETEGILIILRDITERKRGEEQILRRNRELAALNAIAQTVTQSIELDEILNSALNKTLDILNIKHGAILLLQEKENSLTFSIVKGISNEDIAAIPPNEIAQSDLWAAVENSEPIFIETLIDNIGPVHVTASKIVSNHQLKSAMLIPLKTRGKVLGVIGAATQDGRVFTLEEQELLITIGHQISTAIENAQLLEDASRAVALEETDRLRTAFLASVSHEMRTPMTSIKGLASTLVQPDVENGIAKHNMNSL